MRSEGTVGWRPFTGVAVVGALAFAIAPQGALAGGEQLATKPAMVVQAQAVEGAPRLNMSQIGQNSHVVLGVNGQLIVRPNNEGGVAGPMACECDIDCADGNVCTDNTCDAGVCVVADAAPGTPCDPDADFCDLLGECSAGVCLDNSAGGDPCAGQAGCNETDDVCIGTECTTDANCDFLDDAANCLNGSCENGNCFTRSLCTTPGDACDGAGTCMTVTDGRCCADPDACVPSSLFGCNDGTGPGTGPWANFGGSCACPKVSFGVSENDKGAPDGGGPFLTNFINLTVTENCNALTRFGDDYTTANNSYLAFDTFSFWGGTDGTGDGTVVFEFYDGAIDPPVLVDAFAVGFAPDQYGILTLWTVAFMASPFDIPPVGFVVMRAGVGSGETHRWIAVSNNFEPIGSNNEDLMWANAGPVVDFLTDHPDVLGFELSGGKVDPTGACCLGEGVCNDSPTHNNAWLCEAQGGTFAGEGTSCLDMPCDVATCCLPDGSCQILDPGTCIGMGGAVGEFGGSCIPNCCKQLPLDNFDTCADATVNVLDTAAAGSGVPVTVTLSGDNTMGSPGNDCGIDADEPTVWEAFSITADSVCTIDYCCTDGISQFDGTTGGMQVRYIIVYPECCNAGDCTDCGASIFRDGVSALGCPDGNPSDDWTLTAGTYYIPIYSDGVCEDGSATCSVTNQDCVSGAACIPNRGQYQVHVTCERLPLQACCLEDVCDDTLTALDCEAMGGFSLANNPVCFPATVCELGSCCLGAGMCEDAAGAGIDRATCEMVLGGDYIGGARCVDDDPCPICPLSGLNPGGGALSTDCQTDDGNFIIPNDRALSPASLYADDWCAKSGGALDTVCWKPCYFNPFAGTECSAPGEPPADDFRLRVFEDANGLPGAELGVAGGQTLQNIVSASDGAGSRCWTYSASGVSGININAGACYWIETSGFGTGDGCTVYQLTSFDGNSYMLNDDGSGYGAEDIVTDIGGDPGAISFCVDVGLAAPPSPTGACCTPDLNCNVTDVSTCVASGGVFNPGVACEPGVCPEPCEAETCAEAISLNDPDPANNNTCDAGLPCSRNYGNQFCNDDFVSAQCVVSEQAGGCQVGGNPAGSDFGADVWYSYTTGDDECGELTISTCNNQTWDGILAVYDAGPNCTCPIDESVPLACGDDTCGAGGGPSCVTITVTNNTCYIIRAGGWQAETGVGVLELDFTAGVCDSGAEAPLADNSVNVNDAVTACPVGNECTSGSVCIAGECYTPKHRYLSVRANPANGSTARRVQIDTVTAGLLTVGFAQAPVTVAAGGAGDSARLVSLLGPARADVDWNSLSDSTVEIGGCPIAPGFSYNVQEIAAGADETNEANYSAPLTLPTVAVFGDCCGGGATNTPPNGFANFIDINSAVGSFTTLGSGTPRSWVDTDPTNAPANNLIVNFSDIQRFVAAFQAGSYPQDPTTCIP